MTSVSKYVFRDEIRPKIVVLQYTTHVWVRLWNLVETYDSVWNFDLVEWCMEVQENSIQNQRHLDVSKGKIIKIITKLIVTTNIRLLLWTCSHCVVSCHGWKKEQTFDGLVVRMLASGSRVRGFKPGRSRWIFLCQKSSACLPSAGKLNNLSHVPTLRHVKETNNCSKLRIASKIPWLKVPSFLVEGSRAAWCDGASGDEWGNYVRGKSTISFLKLQCWINPALRSLYKKIRNKHSLFENYYLYSGNIFKNLDIHMWKEIDICHRMRISR
jgi:hypothetical protein